MARSALDLSAVAEQLLEAVRRFHLAAERG
jgi:hypothetical protein